MPPNLQPPQGMPPQGMPPQGMPPEMMAEDPNAPVSEEEMQALRDIIAEVQSKLKTFKAQSFAVNDQGEQKRVEMLKKVFEELQAAGVDLSSKESVASFITTLEKTNPEIAKSFEKAMDILLGLPEGTPLAGEGSQGDPNAMPVDPGAALGLPQEAGAPQNNMNIQNPNEALLKG